ncbi:cytochrome c oxidase assembly factor CtaG [Neobacillus sp. SM06]|uniref:cytochrome c oxidase assembly factor CtaG n=1 Tax=Neobacillus sp. SM06 TaxID=3422492 RepID=UPI003D2E898F
MPVLSLTFFGFQALWSPYFFVLLLFISAVYFFITVKIWSRFQNAEPLTSKQAVFFVTGMVLFYTVKGSPLDILAHLLFYVHMIQMAVLLLLIPPFFIWGIPQWIWRKVLSLRVIHSLVRLFTKPLLSLVLFNGFFSFYHVPFIFDRVMQNMLLHAAYTNLLFLFAFFMWWPLVNELPEYQTLSGLKKVGYIFAAGVLLTPACALIIFANTPMYATYADPLAWGQAMNVSMGSGHIAKLHLSGPSVFSSISPLHDQQLGGVLMKVIQELIYGVFLGRVFFEWYKKDQRESEKELQQSLQPSLLK